VGHCEPVSATAVKAHPRTCSIRRLTPLAHLWRTCGVPVVYLWCALQPADSYRANTQVPLDKHFVPNNFGDVFAKYLVKSLRIPTDLFFQVSREDCTVLCCTVQYTRYSTV